MISLSYWDSKSYFSAGGKTYFVSDKIYIRICIQFEYVVLFFLYRPLGSTLSLYKDEEKLMIASRIRTLLTMTNTVKMRRRLHYSQDLADFLKTGQIDNFPI